MNWSEFFAMGGYGLYVWGSYGMAALVLAFNVWPRANARRTCAGSWKKQCV